MSKSSGISTEDFWVASSELEDVTSVLDTHSKLSKFEKSISEGFSSDSSVFSSTSDFSTISNGSSVFFSELELSS